MAKEKLPVEVQTFIVHQLACFDAPTVIADAVKAEFGLKISRQLVETYDPEKRAGVNVAAKWKAMYEAARAAFLEDSSKVATTHRLVRVRRLERMADAAEARGATVVAAQILKQIAEEMGGAYTNRREHSGPGGAPLPTQSAVIVIHGNGRDDPPAD